MFRTGLCATLCIWSAMPAAAESLSPVSLPAIAEAPPHGFRHPIDLSAPFRGAMRSQSGDDRAVLNSHGQDDNNSTETQGVSVGPLRFGSGGGMGRHTHLARFKVEGVTIFGGSVGGSLDGRSANIVLSWPAGP